MGTCPHCHLDTPISWVLQEVRSELDILVVLYKSACSVTVSTGEISFSLLARLEAWEWGSSGLLQPNYAVCFVQFPVQPG